MSLEGLDAAGGKSSSSTYGGRETATNATLANATSQKNKTNTNINILSTYGGRETATNASLALAIPKHHNKTNNNVNTNINSSFKTKINIQTDNVSK